MTKEGTRTPKSHGAGVREVNALPPATDLSHLLLLSLQSLRGAVSANGTFPWFPLQWAVKCMGKDWTKSWGG